MCEWERSDWPLPQVPGRKERRSPGEGRQAGEVFGREAAPEEPLPRRAWEVGVKLPREVWGPMEEERPMGLPGASERREWGEGRTASPSKGWILRPWAPEPE